MYEFTSVARFILTARPPPPVSNATNGKAKNRHAHASKCTGVAHRIRDSSYSMRVAIVFFSAAFAAVATTSSAQVSRPPGPPPWADTTGESPIYPVGEAIRV